MRNSLRGLLGVLGVLVLGATPAAAQSYYQPRLTPPAPVAERDSRYAPQFTGAPSAVVAPVVVAEAVAPAAVSGTPAATELRDGGFQPQFKVSPVKLLTGAPRAGRPKALNSLYGSLVAVNVLDIVSTRAATSRGAMETNPAMRGGLGQQIGIKAAMTLGTVVVAERLWKKNKVAAIATLVATNTALAMISAHNMRNARQLGR